MYSLKYELGLYNCLTIEFQSLIFNGIFFHGQMKQNEPYWPLKGLLNL